MKPFSRFILLAGIFLLTAAALPAQHFISGGSVPSFNGWGGYGGGFGGYGYGDYGWGYSYSGWDFGDCDLHHPQEHPPFGVGYGHGDPDFVQSTYMDYAKAVELGKKILEEQARPQPSLGEIARQLRARARSYVPPPAPRSSAVPPRPHSFVVIQDNYGKAIVCRISERNCPTAS